jgi:hypothetical protein
MNPSAIAEGSWNRELVTWWASFIPQFGRAYQVNDSGVAGIAEHKPAESGVNFALLWLKMSSPFSKEEHP